MTNGINNIPVFTPSFKYMSPKDREEALKKAEEKAAKQAEEEKQKEAQKKAQQQNELDMLKMQLESSKKESEAMEEGFAVFGKCLTIAQRITRGDTVPTKDIKYLMEHEPDLYKQAILMRQPNNDPKKHKSVLEDEDESGNDTVEQSEGSSESTHPPVSGSAPATETAPPATEVSAPATTE